MVAARAITFPFIIYRIRPDIIVTRVVLRSRQRNTIRRLILRQNKVIHAIRRNRTRQRTDNIRTAIIIYPCDSTRVDINAANLLYLNHRRSTLAHKERYRVCRTCRLTYHYRWMPTRMHIILVQQPIIAYRRRIIHTDTILIVLIIIGVGVNQRERIVARCRRCDACINTLPRRHLPQRAVIQLHYLIIAVPTAITAIIQTLYHKAVGLTRIQLRYRLHRHVITRREWYAL